MLERTQSLACKDLGLLERCLSAGFLGQIPSLHDKQRTLSRNLVPGASSKTKAAILREQVSLFQREGWLRSRPLTLPSVDSTAMCHRPA